MTNDDNIVNKYLKKPGKYDVIIVWLEGKTGKT